MSQILTQSDLLNADRSHWMFRDCVLWLPMQEGAGGTAYDISGRQNHGTLTNMDPSTDWVIGPNGGHGLDFDGSNDHVRVGNIVMPAGGSGYTFATWVYRRSTAYYGLFGQSNNSNKRHLVFLRNDGVIDGIFGDGAAQFNIPDDTDTVPLNIWTHVALALDFKGTCIRYLNGRKTGSTSSVSGLDGIVTDGNSDTLGARKRTASTEDVYLNGLMADSRYWNRKLSDSEIYQIYLDPWQPFARRKTFGFLSEAAPPTFKPWLAARRTASIIGGGI